MNSDLADSSSNSSFPGLVPLPEEAPRQQIVPLPRRREQLVLKALSRAVPIELAPEELEYLEANTLIKRMSPDIEEIFQQLPAMVSELWKLGGKTRETLDLVRPLVLGFQPAINVGLPRAVQPLGLLGLAQQRMTSRNRPLHALIRQAKSEREVNQARFVDLCLEVKRACNVLPRYRHNHQSYVPVGLGRARITGEGLKRLRLLKLEERLFDDFGDAPK